MSFGKYGKVRTLAPPFIFSVACARAGVPVLVISPTSGGKSTVIFAVDGWLTQHGEPTDQISRLGLRGLKDLAKWLEYTRVATILNEDYSSIGASTYMTEKMGEIIGSLTFSKTYADKGIGVDLSVTRLGFVSGVQPQWLMTMMSHPVFATFLREKFVRYYMLPYTPSEDVEDFEAQEILRTTLEEKPLNPNVRVPIEFRQAMAMQVGQTRGKKFSDLIAPQLSALLPEWCLHRAMKFYGQRLAFEFDMVTRELDKTGFKTSARWHEYIALYWALRRGQLTKEEYMARFGVTSIRSVERVLESALALRWITSKWDNGIKVFMPSDEARGKLAWKEQHRQKEEETQKPK